MAEPELTLFIVRHGESRGNCGQWLNMPDELAEDPPLTEKGERQAELLGEYWADYPLDCILTSGLHRALRTASEVASRQKEGGAHSVEVHKIFSECEIKDTCPGRTIDDIKKDYPLAVCAEGADPDERVIWHSYGASDEEHLVRGRAAFDYIRSRFHNGEKVMVVAHGALNTFLLYAALGLPATNVFDPSFFNTGVTKIVFYKKGEGAYADIDLVYHNAVPHLVGEMPEFKYK